MIPVKQTKRGGPNVSPEERGDCFDACLASILEVDIAEAHIPHVDDWWDIAQDAVARHGHRIIFLGDRGASAAELGEWLGPVYWIAGVDSLNLGTYDDGQPVGHVIVMRGDEVVHDPSLGKCYPPGPLPDEVRVRQAYLVMPLVPRSLKAAA